MQLRLITPPTDTPVTVGDLRKQLEIGDDPSHDEHCLRLIQAATDEIERITRRSLLRQQWRCEVRCPVGSIELPRPPFIEIAQIGFKSTLSGAWTDDPTGYELDSIASPAIVRVRRSCEYIQVDYWAGVETPAELSADIRDAVLQLACFKFEFRGDTSSGGSMGTAWPIALRGLIDGLKIGTVAGYY